MSSINEQLKAIDKELVDLENRKQVLIERKARLEKTRQSQNPSNTNKISAEERISIFTELFKGRSDVFALKWENPKSGRSGYSPACHNEWKQGICNKPYTKYTVCKKQNFKKLNQQEIYKHLTGTQVIGSYALGHSGACKFLAIDFDKSDWQLAVKSTAQAAVTLDVPHAVEISQSGSGAHLWVFFSENVPAKLARRLGFLLLDKAMELSPSLTFDSYDRLFPNQDLLPEGGFGNLIGLPLQQQRRKDGFTEFVTAELAPIEDQWQFLKHLPRMSHLDVVAKVKSNSGDQSIDEQPWERQSVTVEIIPDCPEELTIIRANRLFIPVVSLPSKLVSCIRRIASFSNPEFFKKQALRFSTYDTPRFISLARIEGDYLSIPRGCEDDLIDLLQSQNIKPHFDVKTVKGKRLTKIKMTTRLRKEQTKAVNKIIKHDIGVLHAPTAFGKTVTAIGIIAKRKTNTLVLVHNKQLIDQWRERINTFTTGIQCGVHTGPKKSVSNEVDIATYQSLINRKDNTVNSILHNYGQFIIDECHHVPAASFERVLSETSAKYIVGLTATPNRQDGLQKIMFMLAGKVRHRVLNEAGNSFTQKVFVKTSSAEIARSNQDDLKLHISEIYKWLTEDEQRNSMIVGDVIAAANEGRHCLLLSERRGHAEKLLNMLIEQGLMCVLLTGGMSAKQRRETNEALPDSQVLVATGKYIGEGFDLPRLDTLFITLPISWKGTLAQYAGRIHRDFDDKEEVRIYDYVEISEPMLNRMYQKREKGYLALGYEVVQREK